MALNLARLGNINTAPEDNEGVLDYLQKRRSATAAIDAQRAQDARAQEELKIKQAEEARAQQADTEARAAAQQAQAKQNAINLSTGKYIENRDFAQNAPLGVVNPRFLGKQEMGPQRGEPTRDISSLDREQVMNLAKIDPNVAETFRKGRQTEDNAAIDRQRTMATADTNAANAASTERFRQGDVNRGRTETERHNKADEWLKQLGIISKPANASNTIGLTPGEKALDMAFAKDYQDFTSGQFASAQKGLAQIKEIKARLEKGEKLTGPVRGSLPDFMRKFTDPEGLDARQQVEQVVQNDLRPTLGAQFTAKEGESLIKRSFDPNLSPKKNAEKLQRLLTQMDAALKAKMAQGQYFEEHGTLKGYKAGKQYLTSSDFDLDGNQDNGTPTNSDLSPEEAEELRQLEEAAKLEGNQ